MVRCKRLHFLETTLYWHLIAESHLKKNCVCVRTSVVKQLFFLRYIGVSIVFCPGVESTLLRLRLQRDTKASNVAVPSTNSKIGFLLEVYLCEDRPTTVTAKYVYKEWMRSTRKMVRVPNFGNNTIAVLEWRWYWWLKLVNRTMIFCVYFTH